MKTKLKKWRKMNRRQLRDTFVEKFIDCFDIDTCFKELTEMNEFVSFLITRAKKNKAKAQ